MATDKLSLVIAEGWEGGGTLAASYSPIVEAFEERAPGIVHHAGTSAGAITALLRAILAPAAHIRELQELTPWDRFAGYRPPAFIRLLLRGGWHPIDYARSWIADRLRDAGLPNGLTFAGLKKRKGHSLYVAATRYFRHVDGGVEAEPYLFSPATTPDAPVGAAVLASMAVPLFWPPVGVGGWFFCDGGVAQNHPLSVFAQFPLEQIVGIRLDSRRELLFESGEIAKEPVRPGIGGIVAANATMLRTIANRTFVPDTLWPRIIRIDTGDESALDFRANPDRLVRLRAAGSAALDSWLAMEEHNSELQGARR